MLQKKKTQKKQQTFALQYRLYKVIYEYVVDRMSVNERFLPHAYSVV